MRFILLTFVTCMFSNCYTQQLQTTTAINTSTNKPYNIILIVADDLGRNDLVNYGNSFIETPNLTAMAATGMQFNKAYAAAPLCSPTRASIITGNNPARINLTEHLHGYATPGPKIKLVTPRIEPGLPPALTTIPEVLVSNNYSTAHFGKWHLGGGASSPANNGFQLVYGGGVEGLPKSFFYPFFNGQPYKDLLADTKEGDYLDDALTTKALAYIKEKKNNNFFIELNFYAPHVPIQGKPALVKKYAEKRAATNFKGLPEDEYAAMVESIDNNLGRVLATLKEQELDQNTMVIFVSDNGGLNVQEVPAFASFTPPTTCDPLKGGKGYLYEGGIRTPFIVWMPSKIAKPSINETMVTTDDIFNTCMEVAQVKAKSPDGVSIMRLLNNDTLVSRNYYLHFPHYSPQHGKPGAVIIQGDYKLIEWYETEELELFNLKTDIGETNNIAKANKALVKKLHKELKDWRVKVGAKMPEQNPLYEGE